MASPLTEAVRTSVVIEVLPGLAPGHPIRVHAGAHLRSTTSVSELDLVVLRADVELIAGPLVAFPDPVGMTPVWSRCAIAAAELEESRLERVEVLGSV